MIEPVAIDVGVGAGDSVARLFDQHADRLVGLACLLLRDRGEAEEVVQEAFLRLQRRAGPPVEAGQEAAYLRSIVLNLARSRLRRRRVALLRRPLPFVPGARPDEVVELRDEQRRIVEALRRLPARQRECLVLRFYAELSDHEVAAALGIKVTSVRTHIQRGKAAIEKEMTT